MVQFAAKTQRTKYIIFIENVDATNFQFHVTAHCTCGKTSQSNVIVLSVGAKTVPMAPLILTQGCCHLDVRWEEPYTHVV